MSPAAKLMQVMELYDSGLLCKCENWFLDEEEVSTLEHESDCEGREKMKQLLYPKEAK